MAEDTPDKTSYIYNSQLDAFTLYHVSQESDRSHSSIGPVLPALGHAVSGAAGTAISKVVTYPLDLVITRLQVQRQLQRDDKHSQYSGILDAIEKIYEREGGLPAFYAGVAHDLFKSVTDSFLFFLAYSYVRQSRLDAKESRRGLPALEEIGVGVIAGAFSKFWTTPIQQIVTRKQTASMMTKSPASKTPPLSSTRDIVREILREKGIAGFWSGYSASLVLTLNPSITMLLHKVLLRVLVPRAKRDDPGARVTFLLAAISKALASMVTYPFSLAKTRAQVSAQKPTDTTGDTTEFEKTSIPPASKAVRARQRTVFSTILRIAETEGLLGLYQGLGGEVLKGFFSHGITMLMKDRIHSSVISLYYTIISALKEHANPKELTKSASEGVKHATEQVGEQASQAYAKGAGLAEAATEKIKGIIAEGSQQGERLLDQSKDQVSEAYSNAKSASDATVTRVNEAVNTTSTRVGQFVDDGKDTIGNAIQGVKDAALDTHIRDIDGPDKGIKE